jgi:hypothetical protein
MATITFDTHQFIKTLRDGGIGEEQAEAIARAFQQAHLEVEVATKRDIERLEIIIREMEYRMTIKLGGMMMASIAVVAALVKLL